MQLKNMKLSICFGYKLLNATTASIGFIYNSNSTTRE